MNVISPNDLRQLAKMTGEYVASIYMPASVGAENRQNPVRFKNLVRAAGQKMRGRNIGEPAIQKMTVSALTLLEQVELWQELAHGLAAFVSRDRLHAWPLPFACAESCFVSQHPHLLPLVPWVTSDAPYFVLAISQNGVRLLKGTRAAIEEVAVPNLPANLSEALHYDTRQPTVQVHTGQPQLRGKESAVYHGQGGEADVAKDELAAYFREVDRAVDTFLSRHTEPLVFAGVDYLFPIYQSVNSYPQLVANPLPGNPELLSPAQLGERAWPLVEAAAADSIRVEVEKYWSAAGHGRTLDELDRILPAAQAGAIETLFVAPNAQLQGRYLSRSDTIRLDDPPKGDSEDLLNLTAVLVLQSDGQVESMDADRIPGGGPTAAILRYPFKRIPGGNSHPNGKSLLA